MKSADYCYGEITPTPPPTPFPTPAGWVSTRIEAVDYTDQVGMEFNPNPVPHLGFIEDGDYVTYNVNFNPSGTNYRINLLYSLKGSDDRDGGTLEARIGGPTGLIIGTFLPSPTSESSWDAFIEDTQKDGTQAKARVQDLWRKIVSLLLKWLKPHYLREAREQCIRTTRFRAFAFK